LSIQTNRSLPEARDVKSGLFFQDKENSANSWETCPEAVKSAWNSLHMVWEVTTVRDEGTAQDLWIYEGNQNGLREGDRVRGKEVAISAS
jgi:hypothetical protein